MTERTRLCRLVARRADERDEAQDAARYLLALAQFPDAEARLTFVEKHPWLKPPGPCNMCDTDSRCPAHREEAP